MLTRHFDLTKAVAVITLACFLVANGPGQGFAALAGPRETGRPAETADGFRLPATLGKITDARYFGSRKTVVVIQDLHCHPEVQKNIGRIIALLDERPGTAGVYQEGAVGAVDTSWLGAIPDRELRQAVVASLLRKGAITGAESYSALSGKYSLIRGLENEALYTENVLRLGGMLRDRARIDAALEELKADVAPLAAAYYGEGNRRFERLLRKYQAGGAGAGKYYLFLKKYSEKLGIDIGSYRNLITYVQLSETGGRIDYRRVAGELQELIALLRQRLPYGEYDRLRARTADFSLWDDLDVYLAPFEKDRRAGIEISRDFPYLGKFLAYAKKSRKLNPVALVREEKKLVRDIRVKLAAGPAEREVITLLDLTGHLEEYLANRIPADECGYFEAHFDRFKLLLGKYGKTSRLNALLPYAATMKEFYRVNRERDGGFLAALPVAGCSGHPLPAGPDDEARVLAGPGGETGTVVAVMGGFHTEGFTRLLREQRISYLVITPGVTRQDDLADRVYASSIRQQAAIAGQTLAVRALSQDPGDLKALKTVAAFVCSRLEEGARPRAIEDEMNTVLRCLAGNDPAGETAAFRLLDVERTREGYRCTCAVTTKDGERVYTLDNGVAGEGPEAAPGPAQESDDTRFMRIALDQARESGRTRGFFSAKVGAVVVVRAADGTEIVARGYNNSDYELHAEQFAFIDALRRLLDDLDDETVKADLSARLTQVLDRARPENYEKSGISRAEFFTEAGAELGAIAREIGRRTGRDEGVLHGAGLYVTLEPCRKCAAMIAGLGLGRVVYGAHASNTGNNGTELLGELPTTGGVLEKESRSLNRGYHFFSSGTIRPWIYSLFQSFLRHKTAQKRILGIAVALVTGGIIASAAYGYYTAAAPPAVPYQGMPVIRQVLTIAGAAGAIFLMKGITAFVTRGKKPGKKESDAASGRTDAAGQGSRILRKTGRAALSGGAGAVARLTARFAGKTVSGQAPDGVAVPPELAGRTLLRYFGRLEDIPPAEAAALDGARSVNCIYVLPIVPATENEDDFVPVGPAIEVLRDGRRRFVPVYAGICRDARDNPVRVIGVPGLLPAEMAAVTRWLNDAPQMHEQLRHRLDLPLALAAPEAGRVPYVVEINGAGSDGLPWLHALDGGSLYNAAVIVCGPELDEEGTAGRGRGVIGVVSGRSLPPAGDAPRRLQALMKYWRSAVMRKSAEAVARGANVLRENLSVSALRGESDEKDPGIGKLPDIPVYHARTLKAHGVGIQLLSFADPAAGEARAGDPALVRLADVEEVRRLVSAGTVAPGDLYAPDAHKDAVSREDVLRREYAVLSKAYAVLAADRSSPRFKAFEDFARKEASWLDGYARDAAARMNKDGDPAATGTAKYAQWLFDGQMAEAVDAVHANGGEISFRIEAGAGDRERDREAIARWFACGFDGIRVSLRDPGAMGQETIDGIKAAVARAKPDAFIIWQLPEGAAVPRSLAGSPLVRPYRDVAGGKKIPGDVIVEMDPQRRLEGAEISEALENCRGAAGILVNIGDLEGDNAPIDDPHRYRLPRDGAVDRYLSFDGASRWLEGMAEYVRTNLPRSPQSFYRYGYAVMGLNLFKGIAAREDEMAVIERNGVYRYLDPGEVRPESFARIVALLNGLEARGGANAKYWNAAAAYVVSLKARAQNGPSEDAAASAMALSGFMRALMESLVEERYVAARGSENLPARAADRSMLRTLLMVADSLGVKGEEIRSGSETLPLEGLGRALAPVREARKVLTEGGRTAAQAEKEIRPLINPLLHAILAEGRLPSDAGTEPEAEQAAVTVLIRLFDLCAERKAVPAATIMTDAAAPAVESVLAILSAA